MVNNTSWFNRFSIKYSKCKQTLLQDAVMSEFWENFESCWKAGNCFFVCQLPLDWKKTWYGKTRQCLDVIVVPVLVHSDLSINAWLFLVTWRRRNCKSQLAFIFNSSIITSRTVMSCTLVWGLVLQLWMLTSDNWVQSHLQFFSRESTCAAASREHEIFQETTERDGFYHLWKWRFPCCASDALHASKNWVRLTA